MVHECGFLAQRKSGKRAAFATARIWMRAPRRVSMVRVVVLCVSLLAVGIDAGQAQDIAGIEDCRKLSGFDKRTGCFQSNIDFLQTLVTRNAFEALQKLNAANAEILALKRAVAILQKTVEELQTAQKAAGDKKPEAK
jgi:hypothetical protein